MIKIRLLFLSMLLVVAMIVTLLPISVFAAEPLTLLSAAVTSNGGVGLTFNEELSTTDIVNKVKAGFTITGLEETPKTITNVTLHSASGGTNNFIQLYLNPTVKGGEASGLHYTPSGVQSLDGDVLAAIASMDIENYAPHPDLNTTASPAATVGSAYTHTFTASGGTGPYTFSVDGGNLPSGLTMSRAGVISGTPTVAASFTFYIMVQDANQALDIEGFNITVSPSTEKVCEISGTQYATLDAALATINEGETKTITLLKSIDYDKGITLINKKITFVLNGHTLNVVSSIEGEPALAVFSGGCVYLSGAGALNVTGPARGYGVTVASNTTTSVVTVTNATGIGTESKAAHAYNKASLTVLGDVMATGINSFGVHSQAGAVVEVRRNVSAGNQGVCVSDATAKVAGNVQSNGNDLIGNPEGIGVNVYDGVAEIGGNITANRVGTMVWAGGTITIEGTLAAPDYIQFADDAPMAIDGYLATTTKPGYRTYQHSTAGTVWVKGEMPTTTYALSVTNGTGDGSYAKDAVVTIIANPAPAGQQFKEWSITPSVTFADNTNKNSLTPKLIMPAQPVTATAIYEASKYTITIQNDGNGTAGANFNSAAEGAEITLTATPNSGYQFKAWQVLSSNVTIANNKFYMLDTNVTVKAIFEPIPTYAVTVTGGTGGGNFAEHATVIITANAAPSGKEFDKWTTSDGVTFANTVSTSFIMPAKAVAVTATYKDLPPETYAVNVLNDSNGTANANITSAESGETISLTAVPNSNYRFKSWEVVSGGVNITDNTFTMPGNDVTVKAVFEKIPDEVPPYRIIKGASSSWKEGTAAGVEITSDGDFSKFTGLKIDGVLLGAEQYTAVSGSTVVTLKAAYIETLAVGAHTVEFVYEDGSVQTELTILAAGNPVDPTDPTNPPNPQIPDTGDKNHMALWFALLFVSGGAIFVLGVKGRKRDTTK